MLQKAGREEGQRIRPKSLIIYGIPPQAGFVISTGRH
jgi:hypothetical protein